MTDDLTTLMHHRADAVRFAAPDLTAITRAGDRRIRRRRTVVATGVGALALAVVVPVAVAAGDDDAVRDDSRQVVAGPADSGPFPRGPLTYATGTELHYGDRLLDAGVPVDAFVQTTHGFVVASAGDVYAVDDAGTHKIGQVDQSRPRLVSDEDGALAGWVQAGSHPSFVIQDLAADVTSVVAVEQTADATQLADGADPAYFYDLDDGVAYWRDGRGAVAFDVATGRVDVVDAQARNGFDLIDVQEGLIAFYGDLGVEIGATRATAESLAGVLEGRGVLSPQATYYAPDAELLRVVEVGTDRDVSPALEGYFFSTAYGWLDDTTVAVIALAASEASPISLLTCSVTERTCSAPVEAGAVGDVQLPSGERLGS